MTFFRTTDGVELRYLQQGEGNTIVFVHGWSGSGEDYRPMADRLAKTVQTVVYDHRGHGYSQRPEYGMSIRRLAEDLKELLEFLELENFVLAGHSMGVLVLFEYLKSYGEKGVRGIILIDSTPKPLSDDSWRGGIHLGTYEKKHADQDFALMFDNYDAFSGKFLSKMLPHFSKEKIALMEKLREQGGIPQPSLFALCGLWHDMNFGDYREFIKGITLPVRIFRGGELSLFSQVPAEYMKEQMPQAKIVSFEGATHLLLLEKPRKILQEILNFMEEL